MPWLTVEQNVAEPLRPGPAPMSGRAVEEHVARALDLVRLKSTGRAARPGELSGGMKMRVSLAWALVSGAEFLLMDEPHLLAVVLDCLNAERRRVVILYR